MFYKPILRSKIFRKIYKSDSVVTSSNITSKRRNMLGFCVSRVTGQRDIGERKEENGLCRVDSGRYFYDLLKVVVYLQKYLVPDNSHNFTLSPQIMRFT